MESGALQEAVVPVEAADPQVALARQGQVDQVRLEGNSEEIDTTDATVQKPRDRPHYQKYLERLVYLDYLGLATPSWCDGGLSSGRMAFPPCSIVDVNTASTPLWGCVKAIQPRIWRVRALPPLHSL